MNRNLILALLAVTVGMVRGAEPGFSQSLRVEDFAAAGLNKLSPAELARLDALVRGHKARGPAGATSVADGRGSVPDERAKVVLKPGTTVEYSAVESRIVGRFQGWEPRTTFKLENGQRWQVVGESRYAGSIVESPAVNIVPGALGSWWMTIAGVKQRVKVTLLQ